MIRLSKIDKTFHIYCAYFEFFNIHRVQFRKKLVIPCSGAAVFAGMISGRY